jgi:hypothetical protein
MDLNKQNEFLRDHVKSYVRNAFTLSFMTHDDDDDPTYHQDTALNAAKQLQKKPEYQYTSMKNPMDLCYAISVIQLLIRLDTFWEYLDAFRDEVDDSITR